MENKYYFARHKITKKFYRGARLWKWTNHWRFAAVLPIYFYEFCLEHDEKQYIELLTLDQILEEST